MKRFRKNKKGFTLVELIVVLVILAILIALLIPTLTGYINRANKRSAHADLRIIANAATSAYADIYSDDDSRTGEVIYSSVAGWSNEAETNIDKNFKNAFMGYLGSDIDFSKVQSLYINRDSLIILYKYKSKNYTYKRYGNEVTLE
ncbi:prepilin-type N-terminal cleavage/methylation domain-containing protein [Anaerostipes sp.]|uniref:prepilin-type N-terminal cleavage/methylation domain-containing protein n=1 Tax=Anaerostipes sp. TaxID=1872530 RepID=UPI0025BD682A|nr:prepilin-type N-terminal cleavage/methylation domain-containing protein [Anaerostipes sp.]MBS7007908.1 prepilin-type N-terminal cleavage/methylation domain-containing protein [Anaerostipes sp.]